MRQYANHKFSLTKTLLGINMKDYITVTPVVYLTFKRIDLVRRVFPVIKSARPKTLYLFSDGPNTENDMIKITEVRNYLVSQVDWECDLRIHFLQENLGIYNIWHYITDKVFQEQESMIYLQEDLLPDSSFFRYCDEMILKYKDDHSIYIVGGTNWLGNYETLGKLSYFFAEGVTTLGFATWKRVYLNFLRDFGIINDPYVRKVILEKLINRGRVTHWLKHLILLNENPRIEVPIGEEFDLMGINPNLLYSQLAIIPRVNLIQHIGDDLESSNTLPNKMIPPRMRYLSSNLVHSIEFPLIHPMYKISDFNYQNEAEKKLKLGKTSNVILLIEKGLRVLVYGGPRLLFTKIKRRNKRIASFEKHKKKIKL